MAIIQLVNGSQLDQAKVCELCPGKAKIWPESKFLAHLEEAHDSENTRRCWKCGQLRAGQEFRNPFIQSCNSCLEKRTKVGKLSGRNGVLNRSRHNIEIKGRKNIKYGRGMQYSKDFPFPGPAARKKSGKVLVVVPPGRRRGPKPAISPFSIKSLAKASVCAGDETKSSRKRTVSRLSIIPRIKRSSG